MNPLLQHIKTKVYDVLGLSMSEMMVEEESKEYDACHFTLNHLKIISRTAKITPKKVGQFVIFWKRKNNGSIEPFQETDRFDYYIITVTKGNDIGQFVFPKKILLKKGIVSTNEKEGKRGFRVYPSWDLPTSKQAVKTQQWHLDYFFLLKELIDFDRVKELHRQH